MADRSVKVTLSMSASQYKAEAASAAKATEKIGEAGEQASKKSQSALGRMVDSAQKNREAWTTAGTVLTAFGAATTLAFGATVKAAIGWESAWTGVLKTVDGTPAQLEAVEKGLRGLTRELPASHAEIAAVAEAAGQLGISTGGVVDFTKVMINLGETTNMSAEEAATSLARFRNIMGTSEGQVSNLGAAIVGLGNNFATTEAEISAMSLRIAGAGRQIGLSEGQVLGLSAALSSVGIEAEAGGTAISTTMKRIQKATEEGGSTLELFAKVSGMSAADFKRSWEQDAGSALVTFITGLEDTSATGMSTNAVLSELGVTGIRESDALLRMSSAADVLRNAMSMGNTEFEKNTALVEEAGKRYDTAEAKIQLAKNAIADSAITMGEALLPAVAAAADGVANLAQWFGNLPDPVQQAVGGLSGLVGVTTLAAGSFLLLFPRVIDTVTAFKTLRDTGSKIPGILGNVGKAAGVAAAAVAGLTIIDAVLMSMEKAPASVEKTTKSLLGMKDSLTDVNALFAGMGGTGTFSEGWGDGINSMSDALERLANPNITHRIADLGGEIFSLGNKEGSAARDAIVKQFDAIGDSLASMVQSGNADLASETFGKMSVEAIRAGMSLDDFRDLVPSYIDALDAVSNEQQLAGDTASEMAQGIEEVDPAVQAATDAMEEWVNAVAGAYSSFIDLGGAYQASIDESTAWAQAQADATSDASDSWENFYNGTDVSAESFIAQLQAQVDAQQNWAANMTSVAERMRDSLPESMKQTAADMIMELSNLGPEGAAQVALLAEMSDEQLGTVVELYGRKGEESGQEFGQGLAETVLPPLPVEADTLPAWATLTDFTGELAYKAATTPPWLIDANAGPAQEKVDALDTDIATKASSQPPWQLDADPTNAQSKAGALEGSLALQAMRQPAWVLDANNRPAEGKAQTLGDMLHQKSQSQTPWRLDANTAPALSSADWAAGEIGKKSATMPIYANTGPAMESVRLLRNAASSITSLFPGRAMGGLVGFAGGGRVPGTPPANPKVDNIYAMTQHGSSYAIRSGEFIVNEPQTRKNFGVLSAINAGLDVDMRSVVRGYAGGGQVPYMQAPPTAVQYMAAPVERSAPALQVHIGTITNPVAEPTSVTTSRLLQRSAGLIGGLV